MENKINILLATYNGEEYIRDILHSILQQDSNEWHLIVSDDGSQDATVSVLDEFAATYPDRITHYRSGCHFGSAQKHFLHLLQRWNDAEYIMFCDQDDVWHPDKVCKTLALMRQTENGETHVPVLIHTDLRVVNSHLQEISPSFLQYSGLDGRCMSLNQLLVQNVITGCTMMINHALAVLSCRKFPRDDSILMHDWWLGLLAAACGKTAFLDEATIDYRQHGNNTVGAKNAKSLRYIFARLQTGNMKQAFFDTTNQAEALLKCLGGEMCDKGKALTLTYAGLPKLRKLARLRVYWKNKFWKQGIQRKIAQILWW